MRKLFGLATLSIAFFLVACEADPAFVQQPPPPPTNGTGGGSTFFMGSGSDLDFMEGVIDIITPDIPVMGSTALEVSIVDSRFETVLTPITVDFSSDCATAGTAIIDPTPTNTVDGFATTTYTDTACPNEDTITATAVVEGQVLQATGVITISP